MQVPAAAVIDEWFYGWFSHAAHYLYRMYPKKKFIEFIKTFFFNLIFYILIFQINTIIPSKRPMRPQHHITILKAKSSQKPTIFIY